MIITRIIKTPIGDMVAGATSEGICLLEFTDRKMLNTEYGILSKYLREEFSEGDSGHIDLLEKELESSFDGTLKNFRSPLVFTGTPFQKKVWDELLRIPYGTTRSYSKQAEAVGGVSSVRAVANANGMNKISIVVPCHRVIGENGHLTGYGGGLWRKRWLIDHEMAHSGQAVPLKMF